MKKHDLKQMKVDSAKKKAAEPAARQAVPRRGKEPARVTAVALYREEVEWLDQATKLLTRAGVGKASRSEVIREAIQELKDALKDKDERAAAEFFLERRARRAALSP